MHTIRASDKFDKQFAKLDKPNQILVNAEIEKLKENPELGEKLTRELRGYYSLHCDNFRVIYLLASASENLISLVWVGHRSRVYEDFTRYLALVSR